MRFPGAVLLLLLLLLLASSPALAHHDPLSSSRWRAAPADGAVGVSLTMLGPDVTVLAGLTDAALPLPGSEAREGAVLGRIRDAVLASIALLSNGKPCRRVPLQVVVRKGYEVTARWECPRPLGELAVRLGFLDTLSTDHRHIMQFETGRLVDGEREQLRATLTRAESEWRHGFAVATTGPVPAGNEALDAAVSGVDASIVPEGPLDVSFWEAAKLGLHHIAIGADHILFVLGLLLIARRLRDAVWLASVFTLAHSVTLGLAVFGVLTVSPSIVEPLIALSLVAVALEAVLARPSDSSTGGAPGIRRVALVFGFGLLHGLGFAGGLTELNLEGNLAWALLGFNIGVEAGQVAIALVGFPLLALAAQRDWFRARVIWPAALAIAAAGVYWTLERTLAS